MLEYVLLVADGCENCRVYPTVLGTKPTLTSDLWALPLGEDRVLVIKNGAIMDDNLWFLEVCILIYRISFNFYGFEVIRME